MAPGARRKLQYGAGERTGACEGARARQAPDPATVTTTCSTAPTASVTVPVGGISAPSAPGLHQGAQVGSGSRQYVRSGGLSVRSGRSGVTPAATACRYSPILQLSPIIAK